MIVQYKNVLMYVIFFLNKIAFHEAFNSSWLIPVGYGSMNSTSNL